MVLGGDKGYVLVSNVLSFDHWEPAIFASFAVNDADTNRFQLFLSQNGFHIVK